MKYLIPLLLCISPIALFSQLSVTVALQDATCASNGQITITASGGIGDYSYNLTNTCGDTYLAQPSNVFTTLPPCDYVVSVTDDNETVPVMTTVIGTYQMMNASAAFTPDCNIEISISGGTSPFNYAYNTTGANDVFIANQPSNSPTFSNPDPGTFWFKITDMCGNTVFTQITVSSSSIDDFGDTQHDDGLHISPQGGSPPFTFELMSSLGIFQNETGIFPWNEVGCNPRITITDQCSGFALSSQSVDIWVNGTLDCVNFALGTASLSPRPGRAPFIFEVETPAGTFTSMDGIFTDLPPNAAYYNFYIEDACGKRKLIDYTTRLQLNFESTSNGCNDDNIIFAIERQCSGPLYPMTVTCMNCEDLDFVEDVYPWEEIQFSNHLPGEWDILVVDQTCGDSIRCQDSLFLELTPACDSILALVVDKFFCDNNTESRRIIYDSTTVFSIRDENGVLLEEGNTTGVFNNLPLGVYEITAFLACDTLISTITLNAATPINPYFETNISYGSYEGDTCRYNYSFSLEKTLGPFVLSGGVDGSHYEVFNNYGEDNCRFYYFSLPPGTYTLASMSRCGEIILELPNLPFNDLGEVTVLSNCPSGGVIKVDGSLRSAFAWRNLLAPYNLNIKDLTKGDRYRVDGQYYTSSTITGLSPGNHTLYLHPLYTYAACPVDSVSFFIEEYLPVELNTVGNILCDNSAFTNLEVIISKGNAPYTFTEIDCASPTVQLASYDLYSLEQLIIEDLSLGIYCFVVRDACGISSDYQEEIRYYEDEIEFSYSCDSTILLTVDSLNFPILWKNEQNETIATGASFSQIAPNSDRVFTVELQLPTCSIERSIDVPYRTIFPSLSLSPSNIDTLILCGNETAEIVIETDADIIIWNTGDNDSIFSVSATGQYLVEVTNDIGCIRSDSINVLKVALPTPEIIAPEGFCTDTFAVLNLNQHFTSVLWSNNSTEDSLIIINGGEYLIEVSNAYGCTQRDSAFISEWELPVFSIEGEHIICPNTSVQIQPDTAFESYSWSTGESALAIEVFAGNYQVTVTDEHACKDSGDFSIEEFPQISAHLQGDTLICQGAEASFQFNLEESMQSASVSIEFDDGTILPPFNLAPNDTFNFIFNNSTTLNINSIEVEDYNCPIDIFGQAVVTVPTPPQPNIVAPEGFCSDTSAILTLNEPFPSIIWSNTIHSDSLTVLEGGEYFVAVMDEYGCIETDTVFISKWELPIVIINGDSLICPTASTLLETNLNFETYVWNTGETSSTIETPAGHYFVTISDEHACESIDSIFVQELPQLRVDLQGDTLICKNDEASIQFYLEESLLLTNVVIGIQPSGELLSFELEPNDTFNLTFNTASILNINTAIVEGYDCPIDIFGEVEISVTDENITFESTDVSCPEGENGNILATAESQSPPFQYIWNNGATGELTTGLIEGNYVVTVIDNLGCKWADSIFINAPNLITPIIITYIPRCHNENNGMIAVDNITGGTPPFTAMFSNSQVTIPYENATLPYGEYSISFLDANQCPWDTFIYLSNPPLLTVFLGEDEEIALGDSISLTALTNLSNIESWKWNTQSLIDSTPTINVRPFFSTTYQVIVNSFLGCEASDEIIIYVDREVGVYIPNAFSPNGDGINDYFSIFTDSSITNINQFEIYDRWGESIFKNTNFPANQPSLGWNGKVRGKKVPPAVFVYTIEVELIDGGIRQYSGDVLLIR